MDSSQKLNSEEKKEKRKKAEGTNQENQEQYRVVISKEANAGLEEVVTRINDGFDAGAVSRSDVAIYVFSNLSKLLSDADIKTMRTLHFDERRVLSTLLKQEEDLPEEIRRALRDYCGVAEKEKRRASQAANKLSTGNFVDNSSAV